MLNFTFSIYVILILLMCCVSGHSKLNSEFIKRDAKRKFAEMLREILQINELQLQTVNKLIKLQMREPFKESFKDGAPFSGGRRFRLTIMKKHSTLDIAPYPLWYKGNLRLFNEQEKNSKHHSNTDYEKDHYSLSPTDETSSADNVKLKGKILNNYLRRNWKESLKASSAGLCYRACIKSIKTACKSFECVRNLFYEAEDECRRNCKFQFYKGKYSASE